MKINNGTVHKRSQKAFHELYGLHSQFPVASIFLTFVHSKISLLRQHKQLITRPLQVIDIRLDILGKISLSSFLMMVLPSLIVPHFATCRHTDGQTNIKQKNVKFGCGFFVLLQDEEAS